MDGFGGLLRWLLGRPLRALFIGNSLTYHESGAAGQALVLNDLPGLLTRMSRCRSERRVLTAQRLTSDGASLEDHAESRLLEARLRPGAWDLVVLQERSERTAAGPDVDRRALQGLHARIRAAGARTLVFSTWAAETTPDAGPGALLVPVGPAWRAAQLRRPDIPLRMRDGLHAGPLGAYLSACVFYACLYSESSPEPETQAAADDAAAVEALRQAHLKLLDDEAGPAASGSDLAFLRETAWETVRG